MDKNFNVYDEFCLLSDRKMTSKSQTLAINSKTADCDKYESENGSIRSAVRELNSSDAKSSENGAKKRAKTYEEIKFLEEMFEKDPTWSRKTVQI